MNKKVKKVLKYLCTKGFVCLGLTSFVNCFIAGLFGLRLPMLVNLLIFIVFNMVFADDEFIKITVEVDDTNK